MRLALIVLLATPSALAEVIHFDGKQIGAMPSDWSVAMTNSGGLPKWEIRRDSSAPTPPNVLAQVSTDPTSARFPLAIYQKAAVKEAAQQFFCNFRPVVGQDPPFSYLGRSKGEARTETQETSTLIAGLRKGNPLRWWGSS